MIGKGGARVGMGHLVRLASLINVFCPFFKITLLTNQDRFASYFLKQKKIMHHVYKDYSGLLQFAKYKAKSTLIIADIPDIPINILKKLQDCCNFLIVFDDLWKIARNDINGLIIRPQETFKKTIERKGNCFLLAGADYFPLRGEFRLYRKKKTFNPSINNILLVFGGMPPAEKVLSLSKALDSVLDKKIHLRVVLGYVSKKIKRHFFSQRVFIYRKVNNIAALIAKADLAIISGGFIKFEFMCIGTPFALAPINPDQELLAKKFSNKGYGVYLGRLKHLTVDKNKLSLKLSRLISSQQLRKEIFQRSRELIDGRGSTRILKAAKKLIEKGSL